MSEQELREALERATAAIDDPALFIEVHPMYRAGWLYAVDWIKSDLARDAHDETLDVETLRAATLKAAERLERGPLSLSERHGMAWLLRDTEARLRAEATPEGER